MTNTADGCSGTELNKHSLEVAEKSCCRGDAVEDRGGAVNKALGRVSNGWSKFRGFPLEVNVKTLVGVVLWYISVRLGPLKKEI